MEFVFGWILSINPNNVNEGAREAMIRYQRECNHALFDYFTKGMKRERERLREENRLLEERDSIKMDIERHKSEVSELKSLLCKVETELISIREDRHNPQLTLFD